QQPGVGQLVRTPALARPARQLELAETESVDGADDRRLAALAPLGEDLRGAQGAVELPAGRAFETGARRCGRFASLTLEASVLQLGIAVGVGQPHAIDGGEGEARDGPPGRRRAF